jgi:hypothetical protein
MFAIFTTYMYVTVPQPTSTVLSNPQRNTFAYTTVLIEC